MAKSIKMTIYYRLICIVLLKLNIRLISNFFVNLFKIKTLGITLNSRF